jgi:hypothetical protein
MRRDDDFDERPEGDPELSATPRSSSGVRPRQVIIGASVLVLARRGS